MENNPKHFHQNLESQGCPITVILLKFSLVKEIKMLLTSENDVYLFIKYMISYIKDIKRKLLNLNIHSSNLQDRKVVRPKHPYMNNTKWIQQVVFINACTYVCKIIKEESMMNQRKGWTLKLAEIGRTCDKNYLNTILTYEILK